MALAGGVVWLRSEFLDFGSGHVHLSCLVSFACWYQVKGGEGGTSTVTEWESISSLCWMYKETKKTNKTKKSLGSKQSRSVTLKVQCRAIRTKPVLSLQKILFTSRLSNSLFCQIHLKFPTGDVNFSTFPSSCNSFCSLILFISIYTWFCFFNYILFVSEVFLAVSVLNFFEFFLNSWTCCCPCGCMLSLSLILRSSFKCLCKPRLPPQGLCFLAFFLYSLQVSFFCGLKMQPCVLPENTLYNLLNISVTFYQSTEEEI